MSARFHGLWPLLLGLCLAFPVASRAENSGSVRPVLKRLLSRDHDIGPAQRHALAIVIDRYVPQCPAARFKGHRIEDALHISSQSDGSFVINVDIACDRSKDEPQMRYIGQRIVLDADGSLRARNDLYRPSAQFAAKLRAAERRVRSEARKEPTARQLRQRQVAHVLNVLDADASVTGLKKRIYRTIVERYFPTCPDFDSAEVHSIRDVVWLHTLNKGYVAVLRVACEWKDAQAFRLDRKGRVTTTFSLPLGKYGFSPQPEMKVADLTGDGEQELYYSKVFPTSSVPVFSRYTEVYKFNPATRKMVTILDLETEMQDCFSPSHGQGEQGKERLLTLDFRARRGHIQATAREERIDCDGFSWGEKPIRVERVVRTTKTDYVWDPHAFRFVKDKK